MNKLQHSLLEILYLPNTYIHPEHLSSMDFNINELSNSIVNQWIIEHFSLDNIGDWLPKNDSIEMLLFSWSNIPTIANLIGAFINRNTLLTNSNILLLSPAILSFISLPILHGKIQVSGTAVTATNIFHTGMAFILNICSHLPIGLIKRLKLHSPPVADSPTIEVSHSPQNFNLLMMAINYANNIQRKSS